MDFHVCVCVRARCEYRCMCVLVSAGGVEWTSGSPREALAERAAGGACARPDPARTDRGPACPFPRAPAGSRTLRGLVCGEKCLGHRLPSCGPPVNKWQFTGHQYQIPLVWATRNRYPLDGPPVSDTLVGSHQCQHPSNLASITAFTTSIL